MVDEAVVKVVRKYLARLQEHGLDVKFGIVYGAQATGRSDEWSDIDLIVVSPHFDDLKDRRPVVLGRPFRGQSPHSKACGPRVHL